MNPPAEPTPGQISESQLTAWAVGEFENSGPGLPEPQPDFSPDPALQSEAEATRDFCQLLDSQLRLPETPALQLSAESRRALLAADTREQRQRRISLWMPTLAAAASVAVLIGVLSSASRRAGTGNGSPSAATPSALTEAERAAHDQATQLFRTGLGYYDQGEFQKAHDYFSQVVALEPGNSAAWRERERSYQEIGKRKAALAQASSAKASSPAPTDGTEVVRRLRMGLGYYDLGQYAKAEEQFNQVLALDPTNTAARRQLERSEREVSYYLRTARDHTRLKMLGDVDKLWETAVPGTARMPADAQPMDSIALNYDDGKKSNYGPRYHFDGPEPEQLTSAASANSGQPRQPDTLTGLNAATGRVEERLAEAPASTAAYRSLPENAFLSPSDRPLSTFSIDVDTASHAILRRYLNEGQRPPAAAVRLEEIINYFPMDDPPPTDGKPFAVHVETASAPWSAGHRLVRVAIKGKTVTSAERPAANLVFLVDTSGSMGQPNKLPLVQQSLQLLLSRLESRDRVALVTYAGESRTVLPSTSVSERKVISSAIDALASSGGTNGSGGITAAYEVARAGFQPNGVNRVILATDGDFNIGVTTGGELEALITKEAKSGVYLSVLAYGSDNLKDTTAELLADKGNGNYAYIDSLSEARRALVSQLDGTMITIAKDVKIQVEFNPAQVQAYRLLGYENRALADKDFNDDTKDAGEIGSGHSVTALYEIIPPGAPAAAAGAAIDPLRYQKPAHAPGPDPRNLTSEAAAGELLTVKLRWQQPSGTAPSQLMEIPVKDPGTAWPEASANFRWTAAAAGYALLLRGSAHAGSLTWETVRTLAAGSKGSDPDGFRGEFLQLIDKASGLAPVPASLPAPTPEK